MLSVWMHPSASPVAQACKRIRCEGGNAIDHAFHYLSPHQAMLWQLVHEAHAPTHHAHDVHHMYVEFLQDIASSLPDAAHVLALGSGGGAKDRLLLQALHSLERTPTRFTPQDVSPSLAMLSAGAGKGLVTTHPIKPIVGDLLEMDDLGIWLDVMDAEAPRIITAFGLLPNFEPGDFLPWLARLLRPQDSLLLSANLAPVTEHEDEAADDAAYRAAGEGIRPQYDNPETRTWLTRVILDWGWEEKVVLDGYHLGIQEADGLLRFEASVPWRHGGSLRLFYSYRHTPARLEAALRQCGLHTLDARIAPNREEGVWLIQKASNES